MCCVVVEAQRTKLNTLLYIAKHIIVWDGVVVPQPGYSNCECKIVIGPEANGTHNSMF